MLNIDALRKEAKALEEEIAKLEGMRRVHASVGELSKSFHWADYLATLKWLQARAINHALEEGIDDRGRAIAAAEARIFEVLIKAPERVEERLGSIDQQIKARRERADWILTNIGQKGTGHG